MGLALALVALQAHALTPESSDPTSESYTEFFTVNEAPEKNTVTSQQEDEELEEYFPSEIQNLFPHELLAQARKAVINLLSWKMHNEVVEHPAERYMRKLHFGRWINDPTDDTCMNTRAKVLVRDSATDVTFRNNRTCVVEEGQWDDPYSGNQLTSSRQIQVDHMVPLKHAYVSGAWKWDYKTRCLYANFLGYKNHLISAGASENMSKGDRGPDAYLPPNIRYRCEYIRNWLAVKMIWRLSISANEAAAIHDTVYALGCNLNDFKFTQNELKSQRKFIVENINYCIKDK